MEWIIIAAILGVDQLVKYLTDLRLVPLGTSVPVIPGVFQITSAHNTGAAWGMLPGKKWFFLVLTFLVCVFLVCFLIRYRRRLTVFARVTLALLLAGALGNAIDRVALSYVRDMFDFCLINFPIFNVADSALTIGCALLIVDLLFMKEKSLFNMDFSGKKKPAADMEEGAGPDGENAPDGPAGKQ